MVFLQVSTEVLKRRLMSRPGHFFYRKNCSTASWPPLSLPAPDERVQTVLAEGRPPAQTAAKGHRDTLAPTATLTSTATPIPGVM